MAATLTLLWWVLTNSAGWYFGAVAIAAATLVSLAFMPQWQPPWRWLNLMRYILYFLGKSLQGGIDVSYRAFHPALPLQPVWHYYPLRLPPGRGRVLFVSVISLLPGTLSADLDDQAVRVHALNNNPNTVAELQQLEEYIAAMLSEPLTVPPGAERPAEETGYVR
jgi:multicomponent Na+:H+ antiporter subunit E